MYCATLAPLPRYGVLCADYGEREPLSFANAPLHFLAINMRRRVFATLMPPVVTELMRGNDVLPRCFSASAVPKKMLPCALKELSLFRR